MIERGSHRGIALVAAYVLFRAVGLAWELSGPTDIGGWELAGATVNVAVTSYLLYRVPSHGMTRVLVAIGVLGGLGPYGTAIGAGQPEGSLAFRLGEAIVNVAWVGYLPAIALLILLLPTGRVPSPRWRPVLVTQVVCLVGLVGSVGISWLSPPEGDFGPGNYVAAVFGAILFLTVIAAVVSQFFRWHSAGPEERGQLRVFALTSVLVLLAYVVMSVLDLIDATMSNRIAFAGFVIAAGLPLAVAYAVLRHRLYGLDPVVNRLLLWTLLSVVLVSVYLASAAAATGWLGLAGGEVGAALLPAALVAVVFAAVRQRAQRLVNRVMYGARGDPAAAVRELAARLAACATPEDAPRAVAQGVAAAMRLPWVAIEVDRDGDRVVVAEHGTPVSSYEIVPLGHGGETVGWLQVGLRRGDRTLAGPDRSLLTDLAAQAAPAVATARLVVLLSESRDRLVRARQEERQRLRRELHDEVSPTLTGIALGATTARQLMASDPSAADDLLVRIAQQAGESAQGVRRLLADLGPADLPPSGVAAAVEERCRQLALTSGVEVRFHAVAMPALEEPTELAAYRIAVEALTNVVRHARARVCSVTIDVADGHVLLVVADDGIGVNGQAEGVGMSGMRERAAEVGGTLTVTGGEVAGTRVTARLPVRGSS